MSFTKSIAFLLLALTSFSTCKAHFPWLSSDDDGRVLLYFSESPLERDYKKLPKAVAQAEVTFTDTEGESQSVELTEFEADGFIGRRSDENVATACVATTRCEYGSYHGTLLTYYVKHYTAEREKHWTVETKAADTPLALPLDATPDAVQGGIQLALTWQGEPLAGAAVTVIDPNGERVEKKTDTKGVVKFYNIESGDIGFIAGYTDESAKGEYEGKPYTSASHYLTLTLNYVPSKTPKASATSSIAPLPEPVSSFGAAVAGEHLYVYSGHTGDAHDHSRKNLSKHFCRVPLAGGDWEQLPMQTPLQGLPLVAHEGKLYRAGGLQARNAPDEDEDLHSVDEFAMFDPATGEWTERTPLPEPRSSHDAVVIDGRLYVVGGWTLSGSSEGEWLKTAWSIDLSDPQATWQSVATPKFQRRALAAAQLDGHLVVIGGMDEDHHISRQVDALNLATGEWSELKTLPGRGMHGFGVSAWNLGNKLFVSGTDGVLYGIENASDDWQAVAQLEDARFFHRLLPAKNNLLFQLAGASIDREGHVADVEWISLER